MAGGQTVSRQRQNGDSSGGGGPSFCTLLQKHAVLQKKVSAGCAHGGPLRKASQHLLPEGDHRSLLDVEVAAGTDRHQTERQIFKCPAMCPMGDMWRQSIILHMHPKQHIRKRKAGERIKWEPFR